MGLSEKSGWGLKFSTLEPPAYMYCSRACSLKLLSRLQTTPAMHVENGKDKEVAVRSQSLSQQILSVGAPRTTTRTKARQKATDSKATV